MPYRARGERGFSLIEVLVSVLIVGLAGAIFISGIGAAIVGTEHHRAQAISQAGIRNFAEAVKAAPFNTSCATDAPETSYEAAYSPPPPPRKVAASIGASATSHLAPSVTPDETGETLLTFVAAGFGTSFTFPPSTNKRWEVSSLNASEPARVATALGDQLLSGKDATGTRLVSLGHAATAVMQSVLLPSTDVLEYRGINKVGASSAASLTLTRPIEAAPGDALLAQIAIRSATAEIAPPSGWTLVSSTTDGLSITSNIYERVSSAAASSFVWTFGANVDVSAGVVAYRGVTQALKVDVVEVEYPVVVNATTGETKYFPPSEEHPCPAAAQQTLQNVVLELKTVDGRSKQTVSVVKRCNVKPTAAAVCGDA